MKFYRCDVCGNILISVDDSGVVPWCCDAKMEIMEAQKADVSKEKHVPYVECIGLETKVKVGEEKHPMGKDHYIKFVLVETDRGFYVKYFSPDDLEASCEFKLADNEKVLRVYEYCNVHGLWVKESECDDTKK